MGKTLSPVAHFYGMEEQHKMLPMPMAGAPGATRQFKLLPKKLTKVPVGTPAPKKRKVIL
jgi:hypothetical protein